MVEKVGFVLVDLVWVFVLQFLSSLIFKSFIMSHEHDMYQIPVKSGKFSDIISVTIIEVILGILKPESLHFTDFMGMNLL
jgi:hypothetical protein